MEVIVPDEFLSIAIGKKGQNVRLASKLTGWASRRERARAPTIRPCKAATTRSWRFPGVGISLADALYEKGSYSAEDDLQASLEDLLQIRGVDEAMARSLIETAQAAAEQAGSGGGGGRI